MPLPALLPELDPASFQVILTLAIMSLVGYATIGGVRAMEQGGSLTDALDVFFGRLSGR